MQTSRQLVAAIAKKQGWDDARIAKELGERQKTIHQIRDNQQCFTEAHAGSISQWLGLDRMYVLACIRAENAKRKGLKSMWERIARGANAV